MVFRVRHERERKDPHIWGSFCSVTSGNEDDERDVELSNEVKCSKALDNDEILSIIKSIDKEDISRRIAPVRAPFFGPARKLGKRIMIGRLDETRNFFS